MSLDQSKMLKLLELVDGPRDKDFLLSAFPEASEADLNEALVSLSLEGKVEVSADGVRIAKEASSKSASSLDDDSVSWIGETLEEIYPRIYAQLGHLSDEPTIGAEQEPPHAEEDVYKALDLSSKEEELELLPISVLALREAVIRNLRRNGIETVRDLVDRSEADLRELKGIGFKKINEVEYALKLVGLSLRSSSTVAGGSVGVGSTPESGISPITLSDWIPTLKDGHRQLMEKRLSGFKLQQIGNEFDLTRERVRQIASKCLKRRPSLAEDRFRPLFDKYDLTESAFCKITGQPPQTYYYLKFTSGKSLAKEPIEKILDDPDVPEEFKQALMSTDADSGAIYVDGKRIRLRKHDIASYLLHSRFEGGQASVRDLYDAYVQFLKENSLEADRRLDPTSKRAFAVLLERNPEMLVVPSTEPGEGQVARTFDTSQDFTPLQEAIEQLSSRNVECAAERMLADDAVAEVAEQLDIRNGNELHVVLNRYCEDIPGVTLGRMPIVTLGQADRDSQVLDLIRELSPVSAQELGSAYQERFGVSSATVCGSFLIDFKTYLQDGRYVYESSSLTDEQRDFITRELDRNGGYVPLTYLREQFSFLYPQTPITKVNRETIESAGGRISGTLVIRDGLDIAAVFQKLIDENEYINESTPGAGAEVLKNLEFLTELKKAQRRFDVVEYDDGRFLSTRILAEIPNPVNQEDMREFMESAIEYMEPNMAYTIQSLRNAGFEHPLFKLATWLPVKDKFYESILSQGYVGGALKRTKFGDTAFFCRKDGTFTIVEVLERIVREREEVSVDDLVSYLKEQYGLDVDRAKLLLVISRSAVKRSPETDTLKVEES